MELGKVYTSILCSWVNAGVIQTPQQIKTKHKKVSEYILTKKAVNTQKVQYQALTAILKQLNAPEGVIEMYSKKSVELAKTAEQAMGENTIKNNRKADYKTFTELITIRDELGNKKERSWNDEMNYILLCFSTLLPPRRSEVINTKITDIPEEKGNYLRKIKKNDYEWVLNDYKTFKTYGKYTVRLPKTLSVIVEKSLQQFPRNYLLTNEKTPNKSMTYIQLWNMLFALLGKGQGIDTLRSAYCNEYFYKLNFNDQENLAKDMATSSRMLRMAYRKIDTQESEEKVNP